MGSSLFVVLHVSVRVFLTNENTFINLLLNKSPSPPTHTQKDRSMDGQICDKARCAKVDANGRI